VTRSIVGALTLMAWAAVAEGLVVGSKNFSESRLLGEIFAQLLEATTGEPVERRFNLAGTAICFRALQAGEIDVYPEYTGTGLVTLLEEPAGGSQSEVLQRVRSEFRRRWDLHWLMPLGFENSYELAVPRAIAERFELTNISELSEIAGELRAAFGYEFQEREDGLVGLRRVYGLQPGSVAGMQQTLKYEAAGSGRVDLLDVYTTDGLILVHDLVVLEDDRGVFPPYEAAPLVNGESLRREPELFAALLQLGGSLPEARMRELNRRVEVDQEPVEAVATDFLVSAGLLAEGTGTRQRRSTSGGRSLWTVLRDNRSELLRRTLEHLGLSGLSLLLAALLAIPLGMSLADSPQLAERVVRGVGLLQTIPSIALLAFMIPLLGVGATPAIAALFLYGLFPILRNTVTGIRGVDTAVAESAEALGMTRAQLLFQVRFPLATPVILAGVRTAAVINVGTATLAAFIGAGGLGQPIVAGLQLNDSAIILSGALPAAALAWGVDGALAVVERAVRPAGLRAQV